MNWTFERTGQARHCGLLAYSFKNKITCMACKEVLPKELELPAKVFGAYEFLSLQEINAIIKIAYEEAVKTIFYSKYYE